MAALKKILLCPYFGDFPSWWDKFEFPEGYDHIIDTDLDGFKKRVKEKLGIDYPGVYGSGKVWDYRCALGILYEEEIKDYDFWATCDFDMVFGRVDEWFTDAKLNELDLWSNHNTYICGCWTLYRNTPMVNGLFMWDSSWKQYMIEAEPNGWVENAYSRLVEKSGLRYKYSFFQGDPYHPPFILKKEDGRLFQKNKDWVWNMSPEWIEIPMLHFRRNKIWPL